MATFPSGNLGRKKKNGRFQSTAVKSKTRNLLRLSQNKKSSDSFDDAKEHFSPTVKVKLCYRGEVLSRRQAWSAFLNEVGDLSFFWHKIILLLITLVL